MIAAYAFLAMFVAQVLAGSILFPERVIRRVRTWAADSGSERLLQLYPIGEIEKSIREFVAVFRTANLMIAAIGVIMLFRFYGLVQQPDWAGTLKMKVVWFIFLQFAPLILLALYGVARCYKMLVNPAQGARRTATLQRRGLLDFVSPFTLWLAALSYLGFLVWAVYLDLEVYQHASISRQCLIAIGAVTAMYALNAIAIYIFLYGRRNPLMSTQGRVHHIAVNVKGAVYGCIAVAWFFSFLGVVGQPHLKQWQPFAVALFITVTWLISVMGMNAPPRKPGADGLGSNEVTS